MITIDTIQALASQQRHMDILEDRLLDSLEQLKIQRTELEEIMQHIIKDNREPKKGVVGSIYGIEINHQNNVGDTREHIEPSNNCWCWAERKEQIIKENR